MSRPTPPPRADEITALGTEPHPAAILIPSEGDTIDGRYRIGRCLGEGGMGIVFLATDNRLNREVAIKILHPKVVNDPLLRQMFRREAETMAELRHPNVMEIYDIGEFGDLVYFVMPYQPCANLSEWCKRHDGPPILPDVVTGLLSQVCAGLLALHQRGLVHGDIKAKNILVSDSLEVMVVDLGLTCRVKDRDPSLEVSGTPGYIAPELVHPGDTAPELASRADVYALGATGYWLLTGRLPSSYSPFDHHRSRARQPIRPPSAIIPGLPTAYDAPILDALALDPGARPDIDAFGEALLAAQRACHGSGPARPFVVLIDDDPDALTLIEPVVRDALGDPEIIALQQPRVALALIESRSPDLVITDLKMPDLDGVELTAILRSRAETRQVPILMITGVGGATDWKQLRDIGADRFLVKPIDPQTLHFVVRRMMQLD